MHTFALYHHIFGLTQPYAIIKARSINTAWCNPELQALQGIYFIFVFFNSSAFHLLMANLNRLQVCLIGFYMVADSMKKNNAKNNKMQLTI